MSVEPRKFTLSIAGLDPCGGAGLLADIKTFEALKVNGLGVTTAITYQNHVRISDIDWMETSQIREQIRVLFEQYPIEYVKIGLIKSLKSLRRITQTLTALNSSVKIIWDPVLKASSGFSFHKKWNQEDFISILNDVYLLTPNWEEVQLLFPEKNVLTLSEELSKHSHIYLKGGHNLENIGTDYLFYEGSTYKFSSSKIFEQGKHGSGCVLSSAIAAYLTNGTSLENACKSAKSYTMGFLESNDIWFGYHNSTR